MTDERTLSCRVCGVANPATASTCLSCGMALVSADSSERLDDLLQDLIAPAEQAPSSSEDTSLDLDDEIVDELLDSIVIDEAAPAAEIRIECPLCSHEVSADAAKCPHCGAEFQEVALAPPPESAEPAEPAEPGKAARSRGRPGKSKRKTKDEAGEIPVSAALSESERSSSALLSGRTIDFVVLGTVAALVAVFASFRLYAWSSLSGDVVPAVLFLGIAAAGLGVGSVLFRLSLSELVQGDRLTKSGRYQEALGHYDRAIRMGHRPSDAWTSRGVAMKRLGRLEEALRSQQIAVRLDADNEIAWCNQGDVYVKMGDPAKALEAYDKATSIRSRYAIAWNNKGVALARMDRFEDARECHDRAVRLQPKYIAAWLNRGEVLARLGDRAEAQKCLDRARALGA